MDLGWPASACGCTAWRLSGVQVLQGEGGDAVGASKMPVVPVGERSRGTRDPTDAVATSCDPPVAVATSAVDHAADGLTSGLDWI